MSRETSRWQILSHTNVLQHSHCPIVYATVTKIHTIEQLKILDKSSKIISCCDKLHNAQSMNIDYIFVGEKLWERFNAKKEDTFWYYQSCLEAYKEGVSIENSKAFKLLVKEVNLLCSH